MNEPLEPGLHVGKGTHRIFGEANTTTVVKVSGEPPWLKMEEMRPEFTIKPDRVTNLVRIDHLIDRNES